MTNKPQKKASTAISPTRSENYALWYQNLIKAADLAENAPVRGCMTIKPWGYAMWENMQQILDAKLKATGHQNAYFPLLIPLSFLQQEANHIAGFAKECAVVTHQRLIVNTEGRLVPSEPLEEPYIIRPTSETLIGEAFGRWIQSYRDLPLLINQWANVMRWEMRPRMFLRTSEFLWQEGHTAHDNAAAALQETQDILYLYQQFLTDYLAMPVILGAKPEHERFPGAVSTYCLEAMMQDKKALQAGTSHFLAQNFAKAMNIKFLNAKGHEEYVWTTSWGVSTRLIGGLIMTHSGDDGLVLPPKIAPLHIVILPIKHQDSQQQAILEYCQQLAQQIKQIDYHNGKVKVSIDNRDLGGGDKSWYWVKKGVPLRLTIGNKEAASDTLTLNRRDLPYSSKSTQPRRQFITELVQLLDTIQQVLQQKAQKFQIANIHYISNKTDFYDFFTAPNSGFALAHWNGDIKIAQKIQHDLKASIRCIPLAGQTALAAEPGKCLITGTSSPQPVIFAQSY